LNKLPFMLNLYSTLCFVFFRIVLHKFMSYVSCGRSFRIDWYNYLRNKDDICNMFIIYCYLNYIIVAYIICSLQSVICTVNSMITAAYFNFQRILKLIAVYIQYTKSAMSVNGHDTFRTAMVRNVSCPFTFGTMAEVIFATAFVY